MKLFDEINRFFHYTKQELVLFTFLSLYDQNEENQECLRLINELTNKINNSLKQYELASSDRLYNIIDNDFITLQDLYAEYRNNGYNSFSFKVIALVKSLKTDELDLMIKWQTEIAGISSFLDLVIKQIKLMIKLINNDAFASEVINYLDHHSLDSESLELVITSLKKYKNNLEIEGIKEVYLKLIFLYFNYLLYNK